MKLTVQQIPIILGLVYVASSAPILTFPIPTVGENIVKYTEAFLAIFLTLVENNVPLVGIGALLPNLSLQFNLEVVGPSTSGNIPNYNTEFSVDGIPSGKVKWIAEAENRTSDDPVIVYSHGGGYVLGVYPFFPFLLTRIYESYGNDRLSILILDYETSFHQQYPYQLNELSLLYNELSKTSDNVILSGDSAGVHLSLNLLRHSKYPVSGVTQVSADNITGALLFSPWINIYPDDTTGSHKYNNGKDIIDSRISRDSGKQFVPEVSLLTSDVTNFYKDTEADWKDLLPKNVFSSYGEHEILLTDDQDWYTLAGLSGDQVFEDPGAVHDAIIFTPDASDILPHAVNFLKTYYS